MQALAANVQGRRSGSSRKPLFPSSDHRRTQTMPANGCQFLCECKGCGALLPSKAGDRCAFCSYGDAPCPSVREANKNCRRREYSP